MRPRIERRLNKVAGVQAAVNYATEQAAVVVRPGAGRCATRSSPRSNRSVTPRALRGEAADTGASERRLAQRLLVAAALTVPLALVSMLPPLMFDGWEWLALALATPVVFWAGLAVPPGRALNPRHRAATMDTLISIGTLAAFSWSAVVLFLGLDAEIYFEVGAVITTLILLGRWLEARRAAPLGRGDAGAPRTRREGGARAPRRRRDRSFRSSSSRSAIGSSFGPARSSPPTGSSRTGTSAVDQSMLTGEPVPVEVEPGAEVAGGTINTYGRLVVRATRVGAETALAQIARLVAQAQAGKAPVQRLVDRVSAVFVPIVIGCRWRRSPAGSWPRAISRPHSPPPSPCSIIACPCALGLATPTALLVGTGRGAQLGDPHPGPEVLEQTRRVTTIVLDKTGTVTEGRMQLVDVEPLNGASRTEVLRLAGAVEDARASTRSHGRSARGRAPRSAQLPAVEASATARASASAATVDGRRGRGRSRGRRRGAAGTALARARWSSRTRSSRRAREAVASCGRSGSTPCC